jgi:hypothetical protein
MNEAYNNFTLNATQEDFDAFYMLRHLRNKENMPMLTQRFMDDGAKFDWIVQYRRHMCREVALYSVVCYNRSICDEYMIPGLAEIDAGTIQWSMSKQPTYWRKIVQEDDNTYIIDDYVEYKYFGYSTIGCRINSDLPYDRVQPC